MLSAGGGNSANPLWLQLIFLHDSIAISTLYTITLKALPLDASKSKIKTIKLTKLTLHYAADRFLQRSTFVETTSLFNPYSWKTVTSCGHISVVQVSATLPDFISLSWCKINEHYRFSPSGLQSSQMPFILKGPLKWPHHWDNQLSRQCKRVNNLYLSIYVPLRIWEEVLQDLTHKRSLYGSFTLSTMRPLTKKK